MPKAERGTPKDIANRQKAKGLQKLRWYCQMCQKQCRDENGFKCHIMSESHQRQLLLCAENPNKFQDEFSNQFLKDFLILLRRRWGTKRVWNNAVYNEYIMDRDHVHMNSTRWLTLSQFTEWLGKEGHCEVDYQEGKGWFIAFVDNDPLTLARKKELKKLMRKRNRDDENEQTRIEQLIQEGKIKEAREMAANPSEPSVEENNEEEAEEIGEGVVEKKVCKMVGEESKAINLASVAIKTIAKKLPTERVRWICRGIVVKVLNKELDGFFKKKGFIEEITGERAIVQLDSGKRAKIHQKGTKHIMFLIIKLNKTDLETVIPQPGRPVTIVKGELAKKIGILKEIRQKEFRVLVEGDVNMKVLVL